VGRARNVTAGDIRDRARTAREHLAVAQERVEMAPEGPSEVAQVAAANAVLAAIAATDALCGHAHGFHATGQDHREATRLLKAAPDAGPKLAVKFARLVSDKSDFTYGGFCTRAEATRATADAAALIAELDRLSL
jgi:hypothetical protein